MNFYERKIAEYHKKWKLAEALGNEEAVIVNKTEWENYKELLGRVN